MSATGLCFRARAQNYEGRIRSCRRGGDPGCGQDFVQFPRAHHLINFGNIFADLVAKSFDQASGDDQFLCLTSSFVPSHLQDRVHRFLLCAVNKRAGIHHDDVRIFGAACEFRSGSRQQTHHDFAVHEVFRAAQADKPYFGRASRVGKARLLRWFSLFRLRGSACSEVRYRHAILSF